MKALHLLVHLLYKIYCFSFYTEVFELVNLIVYLLLVERIITDIVVKVKIFLRTVLVYRKLLLESFCVKECQTDDLFYI